MLDLFFPVLATALQNFTATLPIPISVTPVINGVTQQTQSTASSLATDGTLFGVLGPVGAGIYTFIKNKMTESKQFDRTSAVVNTQQTTVNSLKASDVAAKEDAMGVNALVIALCKDDNLSKLLNEPTDMAEGIKGMSVADYIKQQAQAWDESNHAYYHNDAPMDGDDSKDPLIRKTSGIAKLTVPSFQ